MRWDDTLDIAHALEEAYPEEDIETVTLTDLEDMIINLSEFADDPEEVNQEGLKSIYDMWIDVREQMRLS